MANYAGGTVAVLPLKADGRLGPATDVKTDRGAVGPPRPASAPREVLRSAATSARTRT